MNSKQGNLRYRLNLVFHPSMTRSAEAKEFTQSVLTQWKDDIAGLELPVLGEETYLLEPDLKFPNLEQINSKVQVTIFPGTVICEKNLKGRY